MPVDPAVYLSGIPLGPDALSLSQGELLNNFGAIESLIDNDHADFALGLGVAGQHNRVSFQTQAASPPAGTVVSPSFTAGQVGLYSFLNTTTNKNELYVNKLNQATTVQIPLTASVLSGTSAPGNNVFGWTYLPSGVLLKWGTMTAISGSANVTVNGGGLGPNFAGVMQIQITTTNTSAADPDHFVTLANNWNIPGNAFFQVYGSSRSATGASVNASCSWLAIGY